MTRQQAQHTPGPWELDVLLDEDIGFRIRMGSSVPYRGIYEPQHIIEWDPGVRPVDGGEEPDAEHLQYLEAKANMERIVAAVNAVEGIPTEALEAGVVREMVEALETALWIRSKLEPGDFGFSLKEWDQIAAVLAKVRGEA